MISIQVACTVYLYESLASRINSMRTKTKENHKLYGYSFVRAHSELIQLVNHLDTQYSFCCLCIVKVFWNGNALNR